MGMKQIGPMKSIRYDLIIVIYSHACLMSFFLLFFYVGQRQYDVVKSAKIIQV